MYIAVCDDDADELSRISSILDSYRQKCKAPVLYKTFQCASELLDCAQGNDFSLYLLDVIMPGLNGIEAAKEIRSFDIEAKIVFLTSSPEFALQSYSVKAHDYLLKPADASKLFPLLDMLFIQHPQEGISIKTKSGLARILYTNLAFVEVNSKRLYFHLADGSIREIAAPLSEFDQELLSRPEFIQIHRSYIVNLWHICDLSSRDMTTFTGKRLPISRLLYAKVKNAYMDQLFSKEV